MKKGSSRPASPAKKIEQEPQGLTEQEVKKIVQDCNTELSKVTEEHDELKEQLLNTEKEVQAIQLDINKINVDYENAKVDALHSQKLYELLKKHDEEIHAIKQAYYYEGGHTDMQCPKLDSVDFMIKEMEKSGMGQEDKKKVIGFLQNLRQKIIDNLVQDQRVQQVEQIASQYALEFESIRKAQSTTTFCTNCKEMFVPEQNHPTACSFHPGKLKYFSCRGCGADDYYTCCLKCSRCNPGCVTSAHVA